MKTFLKIIGGLLVLLLVLVGGGILYLNNAFPKVSEAPDLTVEVTPERVANGKHLANNVYVCSYCHSDHLYDKFAPYIDTTKIGKGGYLFGTEEGFPGNYYAKNLTPYHLGEWTDGELFRAITAGVSRDGHALFPIMPYPNYARADKEDIYDIIAYIRTLEPIEYEVPASSSAFPMNLIIKTIPSDPIFSEKPDAVDKIAYGKYLTTVGSCADCHTPMEQGAPIPGMEFAGGQEFPLPSGGTATSANITPHLINGLGEWTEEVFISRFKQFRDTTNVINKTNVVPGTANTAMPWRFYSGMSKEELGAIFAYLQTLDPVDHKVEKFRAE